MFSSSPCDTLSTSVNDGGVDDDGSDGGSDDGSDGGDGGDGGSDGGDGGCGSFSGFLLIIITVKHLI